MMVVLRSGVWLFTPFCVFRERERARGAAHLLGGRGGERGRRSTNPKNFVSIVLAFPRTMHLNYSQSSHPFSFFLFFFFFFLENRNNKKLKPVPLSGSLNVMAGHGFQGFSALIIEKSRRWGTLTNNPGGLFYQKKTPNPLTL